MPKSEGDRAAMHMFQRKISKDDLREQVARVTMELQQLQCKAQDLRKALVQLDSQYVEAEGCCFSPCSYILLRDMVSDANELGNELQRKWYGATEQAGGRGGRGGGGVRSLLQNCRTLASRLTEYNVIMAELGSLSYKELERALTERQATLTEQRVFFGQLQDLLQQLQTLHGESQRSWLLPRYLLLRRVTHSVFAAFTSVAGLSTPVGPAFQAPRPAR